MGKFHGKYSLEPIGPRLFNYLPDQNNPFTYMTNAGRVITPQTMVTDGATIPWPIRGLPGYDPWDWPAGAVIHDWLYESHHRGLEVTSFYEANLILGEILSDLGFDQFHRVTVVAATQMFGRRVWNRKISEDNPGEPQSCLPQSSFS